MRTQKTLWMLTLILALTTVAMAEDWPQWRGPRGDGISSEKNLLQQWPDGGPTRLWSIPMGDGYASPIVHKGVIYMFSQNGKIDTLTALNAKTRKNVWLPKAYETKFNGKGYPGPRATPTIDGNRIYTHGGGGDVVCRKLDDGELLWRTNVLDQTGSKPITWGSASSLLVDKKHVYAQCGKGGPTAVALDKKTGAIAWKSQASTPAGYAPIVKTTVDGAEQLLVFGGSEIIAMTPDAGKTIWTIPHETNYKINASTPVIHKGWGLFINGYKNGKTTMVELQKAGRTVKWQTTDLRTKFVTPILQDGVLYINNRGTITAANWTDGEILWKCDDKRLNLGAGGSMVRVGDLLITLSEKGMLSLAKATPEGVEFRGQTQLFKQKNTWSTPLIYDGKLFVKGNKELVCLDIAAK